MIEDRRAAIAARHRIDRDYAALNASALPEPEKAVGRRRLEAEDARLRPVVLDWWPA